MYTAISYHFLGSAGSRITIGTLCNLLTTFFYPMYYWIGALYKCSPYHLYLGFLSPSCFFPYDIGGEELDSTSLYKGAIPERTRSREMRSWKGIWHCGRVIWSRKTRALD